MNNVGMRGPCPDRRHRQKETRKQMMPRIRNAMVAAAAAVAVVAAGSIAAPVEARANDAFVGGLVGGLVGGAIAGSFARPVYGAPVYAAPVYRPPVVYSRPVYAAPVYVAPRCRFENRRVWDPYYGGYVRDRVRVCY